MRILRQLLYSALAGSLVIASVVLPARAQTQTPKTVGDPKTAGDPPRISRIDLTNPYADLSCKEQIKILVPKDTAASFVNYKLGWCYLNSEKFDDAAAAFQKSIRLIPRWINEREGKDTSHLPKLSKKQEDELYRNPSPSLARFSLGWTYQQARRYGEAIAAYRQIKSDDPESEEARYQTAMVHLVSGNRDAAVEQVAKMGEGFEWRLDSESKLLIPGLIPSDESVSNGAPIIPMTISIRPTLLYREKAKYTEEARQAKIQGTVALQVIFRTDGVIVVHRVTRSLPYGLTLKAVEAASKIQFTPAMKDGAPISVRGSLEFTFNLY